MVVGDLSAPEPGPEEVSDETGAVGPVGVPLDRSEAAAAHDLVDAGTRERALLRSVLR